MCAARGCDRCVPLRVRSKPGRMTDAHGTATSPADAAIFTALTDGIRVVVRSKYAPERSEPARRQWFFLYTVLVTNESASTVQLVSRHWVITDAYGETEEVRGPGVVGEQPILRPGQSFEYTSGCPLRTPFGSMLGEYQMVDQDGGTFEVKIPPFVLRNPDGMQ